jgi:hypothetical protein
MAILKNTTVSGTGSIILPRGTTSQRPSPAANGQMRFNSSIKTTEYYFGNRWRYLPDIVGDGLIVRLDAAEPASYPGSGTTWTDISPSSYTGSMVGTGYTTDGGGGITFDGPFNNGDYVDLNSTSVITGLQPFTIFSLFNLTANSYGELFGNYGSGYTSNTLWFATTGLYINGSVYVPNYGTATQGKHSVCSSRNQNGDVRTYLDGNLVNTGNLGASISAGLNYRIGADVNTPSEALVGTIYALLVYNRVLSDEEVRQNHEALRTRVGI